MNNRDLGFWGMILAILILIIYLTYYISSESYSCMKSPLTYGLSKMSSSSNNEIVCSCSSLGVDKALIVTKDNISYQDFSLQKYIK